MGRSILAVLTLFISGTALAQPAPRRDKAPPPVRMIFGDEPVDGKRTGPDTTGVHTRARAPHKSLIKLRTDFVPELCKTAEGT
jgi:hypothetical protein